MKVEQRMIEILAEEMNKADHNKIPIEERILRINRCDVGENIVLGHSTALTAMTRAVEEETARLRQCEAIVRELADRPHRRGREQPHIIDYIPVIDTARQWVRENPE